LLAVGSEGGFAVKERNEAANAGFIPISLGNRILRTETAALVGLTCILYETGDIG
jgi:16S rRNA (uracil1498-N3)-methyltransferase